MKPQTILIYVTVALLVLLLMVQVDASRKNKERNQKNKDNRHVGKTNMDTGNEKKQRKGGKKHRERETVDPTNSTVDEVEPTGEGEERQTATHGHKKNKDRKKDRQHEKTDNKETNGKKGGRRRQRPHHGKRQEKEERQHRKKEMINLDFCEDQSTCEAGTCCVMTNGTASCQDLKLAHGRKCHHDCQCAEGLHCEKRNEKHHIKRAGKCKPAENTDEMQTTQKPQENAEHTT